MILDVVNSFIHTVLYIFYLAVFLFIILRWKFFDIAGVNKKYLAGFFLLKVIAGITLTLIYTYYYTDLSKADIYRYFNDSKIISALLFHEPVVWLKVMTGIGINEPETFRHLLPTLYFSHPESDLTTNNTFIIRVTSVLNFFSFSNIYIDTLFFNFFSFIGLTSLFKALKKYFADNVKLLFVPVYLLPSVVLWSSGLLKEQLIFVFLGIFFYASEIFAQKKSYLTWVVRIIILYSVYYIKPQVAVCLLASFIFLSDINLSTRRRIAFSFGGATIIALFIFVLTPEWGNIICEQLINKQNEFVALAISENAGSYFDTSVSATGCDRLLSLIPPALINSILRPFVWDKGNLFQLFFAFENTLFLLALVYLLFNFKKPAGDKFWLTVFCFVFALLNYIIIGLTIPVAGAIVHYRVIATPFLLVAIMATTDPAKFKAFFKNKLPNGFT